MTLEELIGDHGLAAIVSARPLKLDDGRTYRWDVTVNGATIDAVSVHVRCEGDSRAVVLLIDEGGEFELDRWQAGDPEALEVNVSLRKLRHAHTRW